MNETTESYFRTNEFGETSIFQIYVVLLIFLESFIPIVVLFVLNAISLMRFLKLVRVSRNNRNEASYTNSKIQITRLIILLTFICFATRVFDFIIITTIRLISTLKMNQIDEIVTLLYLLRAISFLLLFVAHALDGVLYYFYDRHLKSAVREKLADYFNALSVMKRRSFNLFSRRVSFSFYEN